MTARRSARKEESRSDPAHRPARWILLALPGPDVAEAAVDGLASGEFKFLSARNLAELQQRLRILIPDLILLDLQPPVARGMDMLRVASLRYPQVPVLVAVEPGMAREARLALAGGARGVLFKPLDPGHFSDRIHAQLFGSRPRKEKSAWTPSPGRENSGP